MIKSKERVKDLGEVFTPVNTVIEMVDMIDDISNKTILEPTCGNGNFVIAIILKRFLELSNKDGNYSSTNFLLAVRDVYAADIMEDNIVETKQRIINLANYLFNITLLKNEIQLNFISILTMIVNNNIIKYDSSSKEFAEYITNINPIIFNNNIINMSIEILVSNILGILENEYDKQLADHYLFI